jgi:hypothetical protein
MNQKAQCWLKEDDHKVDVISRRFFGDCGHEERCCKMFCNFMLGQEMMEEFLAST